jgi:hypothetical protein
MNYKNNLTWVHKPHVPLFSGPIIYGARLAVRLVMGKGNKTGSKMGMVTNSGLVYILPSKI